MSNVHRHMFGTAYLTDPPRTVEQGERWLLELVELVGMEILIPPICVYCLDEGNEGLTGLVGLTTSHASFHCWSEVEQPFFQYDLYSCREFDPEVVVDHLRQFGLVDVEWSLVPRDPR